MPAWTGMPDRRPPTSFPGAQPGTRRMSHPDIPLPGDRPTTIPSPPSRARPSSPVTRLRPGRPTAITDACRGRRHPIQRRASMPLDYFRALRDVALAINASLDPKDVLH